MGSRQRFVILLPDVRDENEPVIGGKAARLAALARAGFAVPGGFCITTDAYKQFVREKRLGDVIRMELGRKDFGEMRWEEIWDASLRIRSRFTGSSMPSGIASEIKKALEAYPQETSWAVRSTAPGEDSSQRSFAGLHESYLGIEGSEAVLEAVQLVWASLWSDAAMLYRRELALDPVRSAMAVLLQPIRSEAVSGVAFGRDPRESLADHALIEAVPGLCAGLVDGEVDPDRWKLKRASGDVVEYQPGRRGDVISETPLLETVDLLYLNKTLADVELLFSWPPDVEWTGRGDRLTLLQARPITGPAADDPDDKRAWYLTLRPGSDRLRTLRNRVANQLIPELEAVGERLASEVLDDHSDEGLAVAIEERVAELRRWRQIYWDEFIPFAHGVRRLATYYNDAVRPVDAYEFVGLLRNEPLLAVRRNDAISAIAGELRGNDSLREFLLRAAVEPSNGNATWHENLLTQLRQMPDAHSFTEQFERLLAEHLDIVYGTDRLSDRPDLILRNILELAQTSHGDSRLTAPAPSLSVAALEERLMRAVGADRHDEAREVLEIGRISWRLRDNDNLLLAKVEAQLLRAVRLAIDRLNAAGRLEGTGDATESAAPIVVNALREPLAGAVALPLPEPSPGASLTGAPGETPRQLVGQPASPGLQTGKVRRLRTTEDLGSFRAGEILVCDAIQPMMTHLVPLAAAIVERRGGMLIHGAIIARELGIPCVNGIANVIDKLHDGDVVTVDGHVGIVTVGATDFDLELADPL